jgi:hypothetical protein
MAWAYPYESEQQLDVISSRQLMSHYIVDLQKKLSCVHKQMVEVGKRTKGNIPVNDKITPWKIGQKVMAKILPVKKGIDLPKYEGPYIIMQKLGDWTYRLQDEITKKTMDRNHHQLKIFAPPVPATTINIAKSTSKRQDPRQGNRIRQPVKRYGFQPIFL